MRDGNQTDTGSYLYLKWEAPDVAMVWQYGVYQDDVLVATVNDAETHDVFQTWDSTCEYRIVASSVSGETMTTNISTYHLGIDPGTFFSDDAKALYWSWVQ